LFRPLIMGAFIIGIWFNYTLLYKINRPTKTAVSVANCIEPKCLIYTKCFLKGAGLSLGG